MQILAGGTVSPMVTFEAHEFWRQEYEEIEHDKDIKWSLHRESPWIVWNKIKF